MGARIEDYAIVGCTRAAALVSLAGSVDWLCLPRFDSPACFAALLGNAEHGHWQIAPAGARRAQRRHYRDGTLVLETEFETNEGAVSVVDCMPLEGERIDLVRIVRGLRGRVQMQTELAIRFGYGSTVPWVRRVDTGLCAVAGPDALILRTPVALRGENFRTCAEFTVGAGERVPFVLTWYPSNVPPPEPLDAECAVESTERWWTEWSGRCRFDDQGFPEHWKQAVRRSLVVLKALTYTPTGGIVAAPTTSLPEDLGGVRNWDYRYCWLRDATFTLYALLLGGYRDEARAWREWLLRAAAGHPKDLQIMYGVAGERRLAEFEVDWLPGFRGSAPVRAGNAAYRQFQLDVYGEVMDAFHLARRAGLEAETHAWELERVLLDFLESAWEEPDEGIWEVRGPRRHFTHSKVMAWVAFDRAVKAVERYGYEGPTARWRALRDQVHAEICKQGVDPDRGVFVQSYGSRALDASLLMMPLVGFLPAKDARVVRTVDAIRRELDRGGFVLRYRPADDAVDGLPAGEGVFLPCSFWLADNLALQGRVEESRQLFERLLALRNDLGLLAEEYDPEKKCLLGNFPQALTHVALVNTAYNLSLHDGPMKHRAET